MTTILYLIIVGVSGYFLLSPFFRSQFGMEAVFSTNGHHELNHEKQLLLNEVREIEFDYEMGKLSEADYKSLTHEYKLRAAHVLKQLQGKPDARKKIIASNFCASCGAKQPSGARFCPSCGERLEGGTHEN